MRMVAHITVYRNGIDKLIVPDKGNFNDIDALAQVFKYESKYLSAVGPGMGQGIQH